MLICPLCQLPLCQHEQQLRCATGHSFDRARQGYYNLLPVQHKRNLAPGDNAAMVEARRRFLDGGHYAVFAQALCERAQQCASQQWLDLGCGEGYYTAQLAAALTASQGYGLDISREAVKRAARRAPQLTWLVASMARLPLASASLQLLTSVFSPIDWAEAARVLAPAGHILRLGPGRDHLLELRQQLYAELRLYDDAKHLANLPPALQLQRSEQLQWQIELDSAEARADLLAMTPHGWRATAERRAALIASPLRLTLALRIDWLQRV